MSSDASSGEAWLALQLVGPLQSWGFEDRFNRRKTGLLPTKSGILGLCCAALGAARGSELEQAWLTRLRVLDCLIISLGRGNHPMRRMEDFHTVQNTRTADGKVKDTHITHRTYLNDAAFGVILKGAGEAIRQLAQALADPVWGIWLGRKACIPSAPVLLGVYTSEAEAQRRLLGERPLSEFTHQKDVARFEDGNDTLMDTPLTFTDPRRFAPRRVCVQRAETSGSPSPEVA